MHVLCILCNKYYYYYFTYIIGKIIAKENFNKANLMQTFEYLLLWKCSTEFFDIAHK